MPTSYNGWPASTNKAAIGVDPDFKVAGFKFPGGVKKGAVSTVFKFLLGNFHLRVESLGESTGDEWGYAYRQNRNANNLSCHSSGTAVDVNARQHTNGRANTFSAFQVKQLRVILKWLAGTVIWGGDFTRTKDEMHFEIAVGATTLQRLANKLSARRFPYELRKGLGTKAKPDPHVKKYQAWLGVTADGVFGPMTEAATKRTQTRLGMTATGRVGPSLAFYVNP